MWRRKRTEERVRSKINFQLLFCFEQLVWFTLFFSFRFQLSFLFPIFLFSIVFFLYYFFSVKYCLSFHVIETCSFLHQSIYKYSLFNDEEKSLFTPPFPSTWLKKKNSHANCLNGILSMWIINQLLTRMETQWVQMNPTMIVPNAPTNKPEFLNAMGIAVKKKKTIFFL